MPMALAERPEIPEHLQFAWQAFHDLGGDRALGFGGVGPIPFSAVDRYARRFGAVSVDEFERLQTLVQAIDAEWQNIKRPK